MLADTSAVEKVCFALVTLGTSVFRSLLKYLFPEGELAIVNNVFTEQEAYGIKVLSDCVKARLGNDTMFFQEREFENGNEEDKGLYK